MLTSSWVVVLTECDYTFHLFVVVFVLKSEQRVSRVGSFSRLNNKKYYEIMKYITWSEFYMV